MRADSPVAKLASVAVLAVGLLVSPITGQAQPNARMPRIAYISTTSPGTSLPTDALVQGLRDLGYVEGKNIAVEWRWGRGSTERFAEFAADVVRLKVDVIVAANGPAGRAAQAATNTIPIVIPTMDEPVADKFVASLARPGGNITGLTFQRREIQSKRLQLFKEALPVASPMALLVDLSDTNVAVTTREAEGTARNLGIRVHPIVRVRGPADLPGAFAAMSKEGARAAFVIGGTMMFANRDQLAELASKGRVPMMCHQTENVMAGCLMSYSASLPELFRRAATFVDKILKGAKPADLPVEQPTKFEFAINLKTAKALGLTIPPSLLLVADRIVE